MKEYTAEEWLPSASGLGESPLYRPEDDTFFFVDIKKCLVHCVPLARGWTGRYTIHLDEPITRLEIVEGRLGILAAQTRLGFALLNCTSGAIQRISTIQHTEDTSLDDKVRMNDGGVDARGRWWAGSMALDEESEIGRLWRLEGGKVEDMSEGNQDQKAAVINGPVWSPDGKIMYTCNTPEGKIYYSDYNIENGSTTNRQVFAHLEGGGMPDGLAVDEDGHVWAAANSHGKLVRISPEGQIVATCAVPDAKMTSCPAFGGNDMKTLFITSISSDSSTGHVYRCTVDVPGIPRNRYKL